MKNFTIQRVIFVNKQYKKNLRKLGRALQSGNERKVFLLKKRLLALLSEIKLLKKNAWKMGLAGVLALVLFANTSEAQVTFARKYTSLDTLTQNFTLTSPTFGDLDNDGDFDNITTYLTSSYRNDSLLFYRNIGSAQSSKFKLDSSILGLVVKFSEPALVDIDGDGDLDMFLGAFGSQDFLLNTGTKDSAHFVLADSLDPFTSLPLGANPTYFIYRFAFADLDGDGDYDAAVSSFEYNVSSYTVVSDSLLYYKNTGTKDSAVFVKQTGNANPFSGIHVSHLAQPAFADLDLDGDLDLLVADYGLTYFVNTGNAKSPVFAASYIPSLATKFLDTSYYLSPVFVDIDADGDQDLFLGTEYAGVIFYENTSSIPSAVVKPSEGIQLDVYPNPTADMLYLDKSNASAGEVTAAVFDVRGVKVLEQKADLSPGKGLDVSSLSKGMYYLMIQANEFQTTVSFSKL